MVHNNYEAFSGEEHAIENIANMFIGNGHEVSWFRETSKGLSKSSSLKLKAFLSGIYSVESKAKVRSFLNEQKFDAAFVQNLYPYISPSILPLFSEHSIPVIMRCPNYRLLCPNGLHLSHGQVCERCIGGKEWHCVLRNCESNFFKSLGYATRNATARMSGLIHNNVTTFIVQSKFQEKKFISAGIAPERIAILPNSSDVIDSPPGNETGKTVSFVGRISKEKGIETFLKAARLLPKIPFAVAGRVEGVEDFVSKAPPNVSFVGFLNGQALDNFYRESRVLVFPSEWYEGFPNVIVKAMGMGKPAIASRIGAIPEIVDDGVTGLLFEPGNPEDLAIRINEIWGNQALLLKFGAAGKKKTRDQYSHERVSRTLENILTKALTSSRHQADVR